VHSTRSHKWWSYKLLVHGRWFSSGTPASSTTKTGRHNIAEILLKMAWNTKIQSWNPKVAWYVSFKRYRIYVPQMTIIAIVTNMRNIRLLAPRLRFSFSFRSEYLVFRGLPRLSAKNWVSCTESTIFDRNMWHIVTKIICSCCLVVTIPSFIFTGSLTWVTR
jgi:hypothetical protein